MVSLADHMNADPYQLVVRNGTLDLRTGQVRASRPEDRNTQLADVSYDADAKCEMWLKHIELITRKPSGEADSALAAYLQRWAGYTLTGLVQEQKFFFGFGGGNNGKNVLIETLLGLLGTYAIRGSAQILTGSGKEHETILADLAGARMVFVDETPHGRINEARIKALTGSSKIRARKMRENSFEFDAKFKLWIAGNNKPVIADTSKGFWRRLNLVPFDTTIIEIIPGYVDILSAERSGILNWALIGLKDYLANDGLGLAPPARVIVAGEEYQAEENVFARFVEENFDTDGPTAWTPNNALYAAYQEWCRHEGIKNPQTRQKLSNDWRQAGFVSDAAPHTFKQGGNVFGTKWVTQRGWVGPRLRYVAPEMRWQDMYDLPETSSKL
jgi:putative DNA primase/helicase